MNIVFYTNILTPYRRHFFDLLHEECRKQGDTFKILLMAETEANRNWFYSDLKTDYTYCLPGKTIQIGSAYIHINPTLIKTIKKIQPDIVICGGSYLCPGVWQLVSLRKRNYACYYWSESHLNEKRNYGSLKIKVREALRHWIYSKFDGFCFAGELSKKFIDKYSNKPKKTVFVPNLIEEEKFSKALKYTQQERLDLRNHYGIEQNKIVFLCPARLAPEKGILEFLNLYSLCPDKNNGTILIAGDGVLREQIKAQSKTLGLDVHLLGYQSQEQMISLYAMSDIFLLPSLSDPNPLTCIEALWTGLPMLISRHCGNYPEVIRQGENGYVFSYEDKNTTVNYIQSMLNSSASWREKAGEVSCGIAEDKYNGAKTVSRIIYELKQKE